jgi:hypothetical protein
VLDVGTREIVAYARTREEAVEIAKALAAEWRPMKQPVISRFGRTKITNPFYERVMRDGIHVIG